MSCPVRFNSPAARDDSTTCAPASASSRAIALPSEPRAPITHAILFSSSRAAGFFLAAMSITLDVRRFGDLGPLRQIAAYERIELPGRVGNRIDAEFEKPLVRRRVLDDLHERIVEFIDYGFRRRSRRKNAVPGADIETGQPRFVCGRQFGKQRMALERAYRNRLQAAAFNEWQRRRDGLEQDIRFAAHHCGQRLAAA